MKRETAVWVIGVLWATSLSASQVFCRIPVGTKPTDVDFDDVTGDAYVANRGSMDVTLVPKLPWMNETSKTAAIGMNPYRIAVNSRTKRVYAACSDNNQVVIIEGSTIGGPALDTAIVKVGRRPQQIVIDENLDYAYVLNWTDTVVSVIRGRGEAVYTVGVGARPVGLALNPGSNLVYVTHDRRAGVTVIDGNKVGKTQRVVLPGPRPGPGGPRPGLAGQRTASGSRKGENVVMRPVKCTHRIETGDSSGYEPAYMATTNKLYVSNTWSGSVTEIDCATEKARTRKIGDAIGPFALDEARSRIYVITAGDVAVISGSGFDVEGEKLNLSAPEDIYAHSIAVSGKTGFVYASGVTSKKEGGDYPRALAVVDPESRKPDTLAWNVDITRMVPDPRNTYVYCTDQKNSQLLVVQDMKGTYTREGKGSE